MFSNGGPVKVEVSEDFFIGREFDGGPGSTKGPELFEIGTGLSLTVGLLPFMSISTNGGHQLAGQGIDDARADSADRPR